VAAFFGGFYPVAQLSKTARASLIARMTREFDALRDHDGDVPLKMPLLHLVAKRAS